MRTAIIFLSNSHNHDAKGIREKQPKSARAGARGQVLFTAVILKASVLLLVG